MSSFTAPHPFSEQQWQSVQALLKTLDQRQALWLSGFLAAQQGAAPASLQPAAQASANKAVIAFGSETGNCEALARELAKRAGEQGIAVEVADLATLRLRQLSKREHLLLICSTHGDGDPPEPAVPFYEAIMADNAPALKQLHFAVLALGDSSYEQFCLTGRELDERLAALGATRLAPRVECDVDYAEAADAWMNAVLRDLPKAAGAAPAAAAPAVEAAQQGYSKQQTLSIEVLDNVRLSAASRRSPLFHLELALEVENFLLEPGDAVGVLPHNPPALISRILDGLGLSGDEPVTSKGEAMPLVQALREHCDLTIMSKRLLEYWAELSGSDALRELLGDAKAQRSFLQQHQLRDLIALHPARPDAQALVDNLRPLQPRLYDVANSTRHSPDELHLLAKQYRYPFGKREEVGIASDYLLQVQEGESLSIYPHRNARFHLPDERDVPLILVAEGTGIAPYRAFVQENALGERKHPIWLAFAEESFEEDFLYQLDWQQARRDGALQHMETVFHRDQPDHSLAQALWNEQQRLLSWLRDGAHIYFCGDKEELTACEAQLQERVSASAGLELWQGLVSAKRIHRNLY